MSEKAKELVIRPAAEFCGDVGAWEGVPMDVYQAGRGESNSSLKLMEESPARYQLTKQGKLKRTETRDMQLGTIIHAMISGDAAPYYIKPEVYAGGKKWNGNANECKEWLADHADRPCFDADTGRMLDGVRSAFERNKKLQTLLAGARTEISACAYNDDLEYPGLLRARFDILGRDSQGWYFADPKSMRDADTYAFQKEIYNRQYHAQMALYRRVLKQLTGETPRCYIIAVEKSYTHPRVNVRQLSQAAMDAGDTIINDRLRLLKRCKLSNHWPDFSDDEGSESIQFIDLPDWCSAGLDTLQGMTETNEGDTAA